MVVRKQKKIHHVNPFSNSLYYCWDTVALKCMRPSKYFLDQCLSCWFPTTEELKKPYVRLPYYFFVFPVSFVLWICTLPFAFFMFLLWLPISAKRTPYRVSIVKEDVQEPLLKNNYNVATSNVCLLPEFLSRFNNLSNIHERAVIIGRNLADRQLAVTENNNVKISGSYQNGTVHSTEQLTSPNLRQRIRNNNNNTNEKNEPNIKSSPGYHPSSNTKLYDQTMGDDKPTFDVKVLTEFPAVDVMILQETWDKACGTALAKELHSAYPYIVYDAGVDSWESNFHLSNSGLMIASKVPILQTQFNCFKDNVKHDLLASKGLLQVKLNLGKIKGGKRAVGYVSNTHMQAYQGTDPVHTNQMNDICEWTKSFRNQTREEGDTIIFDILGGDFNVDNISPVDRADWYHPVFMRDYMDMCRKAPGKDYPWAVGTEMRQIPLYDELVLSPEGLKVALEDPYLLQHYVLDADIEDMNLSLASAMPKRDRDGLPILSPVGGKRRIDYVMYRRENPVHVTGCNPVTQLAALTDHIPYCLTFEVDTRGS